MSSFCLDAYSNKYVPLSSAKLGLSENSQILLFFISGNNKVYIVLIFKAFLYPFSLLCLIFFSTCLSNLNIFEYEYFEILNLFSLICKI